MIQRMLGKTRRTLSIGAATLSVLLLTVMVAWAAAPNFSELLTEAIFRKAVGGVARGMECDPEKETWAFFCGFQKVNYWARAGVFRNYPPLKGDESSDETLRQQVFDTVKSYLANPKQVRAVYRNFKQAALDEVRKKSAVPGVKKHLERVLNIFKGKGKAARFASPEYSRLLQLASLADSCWEEQKKYKPCKPLYQTHEKMREQFQETTGLPENDLMAWNWIQRRRKEGGDALANAWIEITEDFLRSL